MEQQVAVVTGGAGGIGLAIIRALVERDMNVIAVDRDARRLQSAMGTLTADGSHVELVEADVSRAVDAEAVIAETERGFGRVDFLVNAAGVLRPGRADQYSLDDWQTTFAVNAQGVFLMSQAAVRRMIPRRRGAIVTVASNAAGVPRVGLAAYAASKAAAVTLTKVLGLETARYGIRCNVVSPGSTDTSMLRRLWTEADGAEAAVAGRPDQYRVGIPLGRLAAPDDVAAAVAFLLSPQADHITLHELTVDGGAALGA
ncbi:2,3-dihydro-2,3-dihydroxybenzoate dehydrogenase [Streptomyces sp. Lzd4kr]|nr:2,3-dihydro-2,3-dihydroxybenzoate dehydrogenase [Streptomyces sp. Lzd4kr]